MRISVPISEVRIKRIFKGNMNENKRLFPMMTLTGFFRNFGTALQKKNFVAFTVYN